MQVIINDKKKTIIMKPSTQADKDMLKIIVAFADKGAVIYPMTGGTIISMLASLVISKVEIDMKHPKITREFIQTILRLQ